MVRKVTNQPKKHSQRVAAWIYAVINPMIEGLQRELDFLERGNLTWRYLSQRCEFIRPIQEYVDSTQWPNYFDFLVENPEFKKHFQAHDDNLNALNNAASALFSWLVSSGFLEERTRSSLEAYESRRAVDPRLADLGHMKSELPKLVAEYLINKIETLPDHYVASKFWEDASSNIRELRNQNNFQPLRDALAKLVNLSVLLKTSLEDFRLGMSRKFDLPAAPIPDYLLKR